jgi:hypothetical protein
MANEYRAGRSSCDLVPAAVPRSRAEHNGKNDVFTVRLDEELDDCERGLRLSGMVPGTFSF